MKWIFWIGGLLFPAWLFPLSPQAIPFPVAPDSSILKAMHSELRRSMDSLKISGQKVPHFISYVFFDLQEYRVEASMGSIEKSGADKMQRIDVDLRVGSYTRDQTMFDGGIVYGPSLRSPVPESNDTLLLRQAFWALTDARYKVALEKLSQKNGFFEGRQEKAPLPDWSKQKVLRQMEMDPILPPDTSMWISQMRKLSEFLGNVAWLTESRLAYQYYYITYY